MKKFFKIILFFGPIIFLIWVIIYTRPKPKIIVDFDAFKKGEYIIYGAYYPDGSKMPIPEAEKLLRNKGRCIIIESMGDGILEDRSIGFDKSIF